MTQSMTVAVLERENETHRGGGGVSIENRSLGFVPAFMDAETGAVYRSRFADGRPAPIHLLDGLPEGVVITRTREGRVVRVKQSIASGFARDGRFFTREEASRLVQREADYALAA